MISNGRRADGNVRPGTRQTPGDGTLLFYSVVVPASSSCTITTGFKANGVSSGTTFKLRAFQPTGFVGTAAATSGSVTSAPIVTSLSVTQGPRGGGTQLYLSGGGFSTTAANNVVTFGGTPATIASASSSGFSVTTPAHAAGVVPVVVTVNGVTATGSASFTYIDPPTATPLRASWSPTRRRRSSISRRTSAAITPSSKSLRTRATAPRRNREHR